MHITLSDFDGRYSGELQSARLVLDGIKVPASAISRSQRQVIMSGTHALTSNAGMPQSQKANAIVPSEFLDLLTDRLVRIPQEKGGLALADRPNSSLVFRSNGAQFVSLIQQVDLSTIGRTTSIRRSGLLSGLPSFIRNRSTGGRRTSPEC